jgi:uncharacterized membrane-anchored protein YitT (DUF2179 family)
VTAVFTWLASLITGPVINALTESYKAKLAAANQQDALAVQLAIREIEAEQDAQKQASAILLAEQGRWYTAMIRPLFALPFIIYIWKLVVWDKVLGMGATDPLSDNLTSVMMTIIAAYFTGRTIEKVAKIFKSK